MEGSPGFGGTGKGFPVLTSSRAPPRGRRPQRRFSSGFCGRRGPDGEEQEQGQGFGASELGALDLGCEVYYQHRNSQAGTGAAGDRSVRIQQSITAGRLAQGCGRLPEASCKSKQHGLADDDRSGVAGLEGRGRGKQAGCSSARLL
ncbi:hypothetical protein P7K49_011976 [Saguinus oedipus]|uniref:Uncharacterized protein n=1 Tax=Saguinus oedipus TaxID=9490 RepID=A0ABQ9VS75_SAGOE|nr:hypothetical protein P7K49_011976 [Saguinus oedipus]